MEVKEHDIEESVSLRPAFDAFIFDLDGTLLDTLTDLVVLTNETLRDAGYPERSRDEIHSFVGGGLQILMRKSAPAETSDEEVRCLVERWQELYPTYGIAYTEEYPGISTMLRCLKDSGKKLAVLSNKFDQGVRDLIPQFFPDLFDAYHGVDERHPRKPDPRGLLAVIEELGVEATRVAYVGDSPTDVNTARAAGVPAIAVTWGYRSRYDLAELKPFALVDSAQDIVRFS